MGCTIRDLHGSWPRRKMVFFKRLNEVVEFIEPNMVSLFGLFSRQLPNYTYSPSDGNLQNPYKESLTRLPWNSPTLLFFAAATRRICRIAPTFCGRSVAWISWVDGDGSSVTWIHGFSA